MLTENDEMNSENTNHENADDEVADNKNLSPEEYIKMREETAKNMEEDIKYLKVELEYEKIVADIEEQKTRRYILMAKQAHLLAPDPERKDTTVSDNDTDDAKRVSRKLKTE